MIDVGLPQPYAFNYHFHNGVFRGLAFAEYTSAADAAAVVCTLKDYDLRGRKLRVVPLSMDTELVLPTSIAIRNIPFAVRKEELLQLMIDAGLPHPYVFNYNFDHGIFRGLASAEYLSAEEAARVINALNGYDLRGRKLRVVYKTVASQVLSLSGDSYSEGKRKLFSVGYDAWPLLYPISVIFTQRSILRYY
jgi:RNA recognition motif-containing protein